MGPLCVAGPQAETAVELVVEVVGLVAELAVDEGGASAEERAAEVAVALGVVRVIPAVPILPVGPVVSGYRPG